MKLDLDSLPPDMKQAVKVEMMQKNSSFNEAFARIKAKRELEAKARSDGDAHEAAQRAKQEAEAQVRARTLGCELGSEVRRWPL